MGNKNKDVWIIYLKNTILKRKREKLRNRNSHKMGWTETRRVTEADGKMTWDSAGGRSGAPSLLHQHCHLARVGDVEGIQLSSSGDDYEFSGCDKKVRALSSLSPMLFLSQWEAEVEAATAKGCTVSGCFIVKRWSTFRLEVAGGNFFFW